MNGNRVLLDTNAVIAWTDGDTALFELIRIIGPAAVPVIVYGEMCFGALNSGEPSSKGSE